MKNTIFSLARKFYMKSKSRLFLLFAYAYIALPFFIFIWGWTRLGFAIPVMLILLFCFWRICKESESIWMPEINRENVIRILFILGVIALWVYMSGIGKFVFQNNDHVMRNSIFNTLVEYDWPIRNYEILEKNAETFNVTGLIYYIGYWLPSALVGKLFGLRIGYYAQAVWAVLGIALTYYFICVKAKKVVIWPLWIFIFFSGLDIIGVFLTNADISAYETIWHSEWWGIPYQYSSMTTQLFWVFNQSIPAWLCTMLALIQKNNRNLIFILACCMLSSTFPFVGLFLLVAFLCLTRKYEISEKNQSCGLTMRFKAYLMNLLKDTCTIQNVLAGGIIGIVSFLYLFGNSAGGRMFQEDPRGPAYYNSLPKLVLFLILEIGVYVVLLYEYNKHNKLYYFMCLCLCVIPPIKIGYSNDFCMRASIPFLFVLMLLVIEALSKSWTRKEYFIFASLIITLLIGSITPILELKRTWTYTYERINTGEIVYAEDVDSVSLLNNSNFSGDAENNFFYKYIAK